jgi:hypothetical protein
VTIRIRRRGSRPASVDAGCAASVPPTPVFFPAAVFLSAGAFFAAGPFFSAAGFFAVTGLAVTGFAVTGFAVTGFAGDGFAGLAAGSPAGLSAAAFADDFAVVFLDAVFALDSGTRGFGVEADSVEFFGVLFFFNDIT